MRRYLAISSVVIGLAISFTGPAPAADTSAVLKTYADIAHAGFSDSLVTAKALDRAIDALIASPTDKTLAAAKTAWIAARVPYQQTEVYRFGNNAVDEWEGKVNAWPLDEGLIDYVDASYGTSSDENPLYTVNVIANPSLKIGGKMVDAKKITPALIESLHEAGDVEANVTTGYHAIEFLLWGQDLNGTGPGAGKRAASDFSTKACSNGNCDRRAAYLKAASTLLLKDLGDMVAQWAPGGSARAALTKGSGEAGLVAILTGMGSLSYGELAGERMKLGLLLHDPEEEHDCFSDNTHNSHLYDAIGIQNVYLGRYTRIDGSVVKGPALSDLVAARNAGADKTLKARLAATVTAMKAMAKRAETVEAYDQMIGEGNAKGNAVVQAAIDGLLAQTKAIEGAVMALKLKAIAFEGSDSLDDPGKVDE